MMHFYIPGKLALLVYFIENRCSDVKDVVEVEDESAMLVDQELRKFEQKIGDAE